MSARDMGVLDAVHEAAGAGSTPGEVATRANVTIYAARVLLVRDDERRVRRLLRPALASVLRHPL